MTTSERVKERVERILTDHGVLKEARELLKGPAFLLFPGGLLKNAVLTVEAEPYPQFVSEEFILGVGKALLNELRLEANLQER